MLPGGTVTVFGSNVPIDRFILPGIVLAATLVLSLSYRLTRFGLATRAASENEVAAMLIGPLAEPARAGEHAARRRSSRAAWACSRHRSCSSTPGRSRSRSFPR